MDEITIISLPKVNLELPPPNIEINSLKLLLNTSACHHNLKTIQREKISKQSYEINFNYRNKKKNSYLKEYLQAKRSFSTREYRDNQETKKQFQFKTQGSVLIVKQKHRETEIRSEVKNKKQEKVEMNVKVHKGNLYTKLLKKIKPLEQRLSRYHHIGSLPIIISILGKQSQSPPVQRSFDENELIRRRFLSHKKGFSGISQVGRTKKDFKQTLKDYKIEGWKLKQSKYGSYVLENS